MATRYTMAGTVAGVTAAVVAALVAMSGSERAQSMGLTQHGALITVQDAGAADAVAAVAVTPGTPGQVLTVSDAGLPHWAAAASGGASVTTLYASDFTAVAGSESASISGTGASSTWTITTTSTTRTYGTAGTTAARIIAALPSGWRTLDAEVQVTSVTGAISGGWRYMTLAIQPQGSGTPTTLWGTSWPDTGTVYYGDRLGGGNAGSGISISGVAALTADRWQRMVMDRVEPRLSVLAGIGSAGGRPSVWVSPSSTPPAVLASPGIIDVQASSWLVLVVQSYGSGAAANSYTGKISVRCTQ
jgi:hypothetical protein